MTDNTKIAITIDYPLTLRGGVSVIVESLLKYLSPRYDVLLISPDDPSELQKHPCWQRISGHIRFDPATLTHAVASNLAETIRKRGVALVNFHAGGNLEWGSRSGWKSPLPFLARAGIPCVFSAHQVTPLLEGYCAKTRPLWYKIMLLPAVWLASTYALRHASNILTDSKHDADQLKRNYPLLSSKIAHLYHSRLDVAEPAPSPEINREPTILSVGHVAFRKGQHILAEAFSKIASQYPEWKLVIAGPALEPACAEKIEQISAASGLQDRIQMIGSHPAPQELMRRAAIFVQPSLMDAFPLALGEAAFFGCARIGTSVGGIPEIITQNQTGRLCPPGKPEALAEALADLIQHPERRRQFGVAAHADIIQKGLTGQAMASNYDQLFRDILKLRE